MFCLQVMRIQLLRHRSESLNVVSKDYPCEIKIDSELLVDDNISECDNPRPGNLRVSLTNVRSTVFAGGGDDFVAVI